MTDKPYILTKSELTPQRMTEGVNSFSAVRLYKDRLYYLETRTNELGRTAIVSCKMDGTDKHDELPLPYSVKTRINVYGGVCFTVCPYGMIFADGETKKLCLVSDGFVRILVDSPAHYADVSYCPKSDSLVYVVEDIKTHNQRMELYSFKHSSVTTTIAGADFYHAPQIYGNKIAWLEWDCKHMPWDNSTIIEYDLGVEEKKVIATGCGHFQPNYDDTGVLHFVSDKTGFFNIYKVNGDTHENVCAVEKDFAYPLWVYGMRTYDFINNELIACAVQNGQWKVGRISKGEFIAYDTEAVCMESLVANDNGFSFIASYPHKMPEIICVSDKKERCIATVGDTLLPAKDIAVGKSIFYNGPSGFVQAYYYAPKTINGNGLPPLIVKSHGGPTGQTDNSFNPKIQFWTSRGFAVLDVNYSGSTGFGASYRNRLNGRWGELDVADLEAGALYLVNKGLVDKDKLIISGSSAGGYSVLSALTFGDTFKAGCSIYGIGDLVSLAEETHKFEAKYFDVLVGCYLRSKDEYIKRSPLNAVHRLNVPVLFLQGTEDVVVPPSQSEKMYNALLDKGVDTALLLFYGEGHGFRNTQVIATALLAELDFYAKVLGLKHEECYRLNLNKVYKLDFT